MGQIAAAPRPKATLSLSTTTLVAAAVVIALLSGLIGYLAGRLSRSSASSPPVSSVSVAPTAKPAAASRGEVPARTADHSAAPPLSALTAPPQSMPQLQLSGSGQQATDFVELPEGLCRIELAHAGSSNFAVWLLDSTGKRVDLLVNRVGEFSGAKSVRIPQSGRYLFDVSADGPWVIKTSTPAIANDASYFTGTDQTSTEQFTMTEGLHVFRLVHHGDSNFAVWLLDDRGKRVELLVNTTGTFSGSKAVQVRSGNYSLDVSANGSWTIQRQSP